MLSRADRILAELAVSRGQISREAVDGYVKSGEGSNAGLSLSDFLVMGGQLKKETASSLIRETEAVEKVLDQELPRSGRVGDFKLIREIGRGGMAIVFEAEQISLGRRVALKVLPAGAAFDSQLRQRFLREARAVAQLSHPGIVKVHDFGHANDIWFLAMELAEKGTLEDLVRGPEIPPRAAAELVFQVAQGLACAHNAGLVHRDIKPSNILIGADGAPRLSDFGLVRARGEASLTLTAAVLGTPAYIAPEQARGEKADPRSDIYGLGAVLYALLAGGPPYPGEIPSLVLARVLAEAPPPLLERRPGLPPGLVAICEMAMARDPGARYATALALTDDLQRYLDGQVPLAIHKYFSASRLPITIMKGKKWRRLMMLALLIGLCAGAGWLYLAGPPWRRAAPGEVSSTKPASPVLEFLKSRPVTMGVAEWRSGPPRIEATSGAFVVAWTTGRARVVLVRSDFQGRPFHEPPIRIGAEDRAADQADLAWTGKELGVVWRETAKEGTSQLRFALLDTGFRVILDKDLPGVGGRMPRLIWAGNFFACAWERESACGAAVEFLRLDSKGQLLGLREMIQDCADQPALASNGETVAIAFHDRTQDTVSVSLRGPKPGVSTLPVRVSPDRPSDLPAIVGKGDGFGVVYRNVRWGKDWVFFRFLNAEGGPAGPERLAGQEGSINPNLVATETGYGFVAEARQANPPADVGFYRLDAQGNRSNGINVSASPLVGSFEPDLAWNGRQFGVVWKEAQGEGGAQTIHFARIYRWQLEGREGLSLGPSVLGGKEP